MGSSISPRASRLTLLWILVGLNAGGILLAGLNAREFEFHNDVEWVSDGPGLEFGEYGLAYTDPLTAPTNAEQHRDRGSTVEMALRPDREADRGSRCLFLRGTRSIRKLRGRSGFGGRPVDMHAARDGLLQQRLFITRPPW